MTSLRSNQLAVTCIKGTYEHKNSALLVKLAAQQFYPGKPTDVKELSAPKRSVVLFVDSERFNEEVIPRPFKRLRTGRPFKKHWTDGNEKLITPVLYQTAAEDVEVMKYSETKEQFEWVLSRMIIPGGVSNAIEDIHTDHESGARQLALKALDALKLFITVSANEEPVEWKDLVNSAWYIIQARPSMRPAIQTTILRTLADLEPVFPHLKDCERIIDQHVQEEQHLLDALSANFVKYIHSQTKPRLHLLTLSNSSTILAALTALFTSSNCPPTLLTILESRPLLEGITLAKRLLPHKPDQVSVQVATDASAAYFSSQADIVILGADQVNPVTGDVKNKIGSRSVAAFARGQVVCVTSTDKIEAVDGEEEVEENDPGEVVEMWPSGHLEGANVRNVYFEWVEGERIGGYVTERDEIGKEEVKKIYDERLKWQEIWKVLD